MDYKDNRETYIDIATLYYLGNFSQEKIGEMYNISRFKVSRVLKKCVDMKIVEFKINMGAQKNNKIANTIKNFFNLKEVIIVHSGSNYEESKKNVAVAAAKYLEENMKDGMYIGVSWGSTVQQLVYTFNPKTTYEHCTFIQLTGNICSKSVVEQGYFDGRDIIRKLAAKAKAGWSVFQVPYIVQNKLLKKLLFEDPEIKEHVALFKKLDIAVIGVGSHIPENSVSYRSGYITLEEAKKLVEEGLGADYAGNRLTKTGDSLPNILSGRALTIDLEDLSKIPTVIAMGASEEKAQSIIAGASGGYCNVIIIDEIAALAIQDHIKKAGTKKCF